MTLEQKLRNLTDPQIFEENRLAPCADHHWHPTQEEALCGGEMGLSMDLSGIWKFCYAPNLASAPQGFERTDFSCAGWGEIKVPAQMELMGHGYPQYTDTDYPWDGVEAVKPHQVPLEQNPTGCYVRYFTVPDHMAGRRLQLHFEGVETAFCCWLNGHYIGYSEDSYTPAVFDITEAVKDGKNKLAVEVYRFSTGSWLEDQDFWRMGGIVREVRLTALPSVHIRDLDAQAGLNEDYTEGILNVKAFISREASSKDDSVTLWWKLMDRENVETASGTAVLHQGNKEDEKAEFEVRIPGVKRWSAEEPNLYRLLLTVEDERGETLEAVTQELGFRSVEIKDAVLYINGKRLVLNGVNRHEFSAGKGRAIGKEEMEWDIRFLKKYNFNAVRTSHYPNQSYWYELCDRYGIYVMDETNLETHGTWHLKQFEHTLPGDELEWREACLSRAEAMLERDKNHACIFSWSVGNESWSGKTLFEMSEYFRGRDKSRPVHYENVCHDRRWSGTTDFESRMYASPAASEDYLKKAPDKPYLLCEYSHAMGNSCGNLDEYVALADKYPQYCGGFIWDYIDQSLYKADPFGEEYLAYGGDFGDRPSNYNFCTDGLVYGDRGISPKMQEVKYLYQPYDLQPEENGVHVNSRTLFSRGENLSLVWNLKKEGEILKEGSCPFEMEPGGHTFFACDLSLPQAAGEYVRNAALVLAHNTAYAEEGWELCWGQSVVNMEQEAEGTGACGFLSTDAMPEEKGIEVIDGDSTYSVICGDMRLQYQKLSGRLTSFKTAGKELVYDLQNTLLPNFWRAPTDNDEGNQMKERCAFWKTATLYPRLRECFRESGKQTVRTSAIYDLGAGAVCGLEFRTDARGITEVTEHYTGAQGLPEMPCFGMSWKLPRTFSHVRWYGIGPEETYADRRKGGRMDVFETETDAEMPGYVVPQECGNHVGTRWLELTDPQGTGIRIESEMTFEFSVLPYTCHELEQARHLYELPRPYATVLRLNLCQTGIGGDNSWGAWTHEPYIVSGESEKKFCFRMWPIQK